MSKWMIARTPVSTPETLTPDGPEFQLWKTTLAWRSDSLVICRAAVHSLMLNFSTTWVFRSATFDTVSNRKAIP
jgi:hypothetical protein